MQTHTDRTALRLPVELLAQLKKDAKKNKVSMSKWIRQIIEGHYGK